MVALMLPLVGLGVAESGRLAGVKASTARQQGLMVCAAIATWLLTLGVLASAGFFSKFDAVPPRLPAVPLIGFLTGVTLMSRPVRSHRLWPCACMAALLAQSRVDGQWCDEPHYHSQLCHFS